LFSACCRIADQLLRPFATLDVDDFERDPRSGQELIFVANHRSVLDVVVGLAIFHRWGVRPRILIKGRYFSVPLVGSLLRVLGAIPVERGRGAEALIAAERAMAGGEAVALAPEGRIPSEHERLNGIVGLRSGVGRLAANRGARVVIMAISNTDSVWPLGARVPNFAMRPARRPVVKVAVSYLDVVRGADPGLVVTQVAADLRELLARSEP
jgi:1-acyl-sn-glycerol-3-phosphate acyltransferase